MSRPGTLLSCLFAVLFLVNAAAHRSRAAAHPKVGFNESSEMVPLIEEWRTEMVVLNETRRKLGSFQVCALCTCCGGARGVCLPSPCCYAINCNIPNRPFGFCSFTPKTCNCFGCHL